MTLKNEISEWFDRGLSSNMSHLLVVCDTFEYEEYPVFAKNNDDCLIKYEKYRFGENMQRLMEVYDLRLDKESQLNQRRTWNIPE